MKDAAHTGTGLEPMDVSETGEGLEEPVLPKSPDEGSKAEEMNNGGTPNPKDDTPHESSPVETMLTKPTAKCKPKARVSKTATTRRKPESRAKKIPVAKAAAKKSKTSESKECAKAKAKSRPKPNRSKPAKSNKTQRRGMRDDPVWKKMHSVSRLSQ